MPIYYKFKKKVIEDALLTSNVKLVFLKNSYIPDLTHQFKSDLGNNEIVDSGYPAGGIAIGGKIVNQVGSKIYFDGNDLSITIAGNVSTKYAALYIDTGTPSTSPLIAFYEFDPERVTVNSSLTFKVNDLGFLEFF